MTPSPLPVDDELVEPDLLLQRRLLAGRAVRGLGFVATLAALSYGRSWLFFVVIAFLLAVGVSVLRTPNRIEVRDGVLTISAPIRTTLTIPVDELAQPVLVRSRRGLQALDRLLLRTRTTHVFNVDISWGHGEMMRMAHYFDAAEIRSDEKAILDEFYPGAMSWSYRHEWAIATVYISSLAGLGLLGYWVYVTFDPYVGWPW